MKKLIFTVIVLVLTAVNLSAAIADSGYSLSWFSIDGGGGTSSGRDYALSGAIGQPDAGDMRVSGYTLISGFWAGVTSQLPDPGGGLHSIFLPLVGR